jgi:hypothetical protein
MANISVTSTCNCNCSYCFARRRPGDAAFQPMRLVDFDRALDFLERSSVDQARLLGGEPTLHPDFETLVRRVLDRNLKLLVFSNGLMPSTALTALLEAPRDQVGVLINLTLPHELDPSRYARQLEVLSCLGGRATAGLNIYGPMPDFTYAFEMIERFDLAPAIRLGLAHPSAGFDNAFLRRRHYKAVGAQIADFALECRDAGLRIFFDCGFVPCMFSQGQRESLAEELRDIGRRCSPIPDILPDGTVVACYPLRQGARLTLPDERDAEWVNETLKTALARFRSIGLARECRDCLLRQSGTCLGGCLAASLRRLRHGLACFRWPLPGAEDRTEPVRIRRTRSEDRPPTPSDQPAARTPWIVPYIDQPLSFWQELRDAFGSCIAEVYFPLELDGIGSGRPPQGTVWLDGFLRSRLFRTNLLLNPISLPRPVDELAPSLLAQLGRLVEEVGIDQVTVANIRLAESIRKAFPRLSLTASVLMDIARANQVSMLGGLFDTLVPSSRIMRDRAALSSLREAFPGRIRLIVNEACLPGCPFRIQHFREMAGNRNHPKSLCDDLLRREPWLRLTGSWVLPQHLHLYQGLYDELKLAGRVTLRDPRDYRRVLEAYLLGKPLTPDRIGGGPASVQSPLEITEAFFSQTLNCDKGCHRCRSCRDYFEAESARLRNQLKGDRLDAAQI